MNIIKKAMAYASMILLFSLVFLNTTNISNAETLQNITTQKKNIVIGDKGKIIPPSGYIAPTYKSSNSKVATVDKNGIVDTKKLGFTKITVTSGSKKTQYEITVIPEKESDLALNYGIVFCGQEATLKFISEKYDTNQIKIKVYDNPMGIDSNGKIHAKSLDIYGDLVVGYGNYIVKKTFYVITPMIPNSYAKKISDLKLGHWTIYLQEATEYGAKITINEVDIQKFNVNKKIKKGVPYIIRVTIGDEIFEYEYGRTFPLEKALKKRNAVGYSGKVRKILEKVFEIVDNPEIISPTMSDKEKVKAIHDYIIYNSYYRDNSYEIYDLLIDGGGVCQAYAGTFQLCMEALEIECRYISGKANNGDGSGYSGHAWNRVKIEDKWYYIDCTWDDPSVGRNAVSGYEKWDYFMSEELWENHKLVKYNPELTTKDLTKSASGRSLGIYQYY